MKNLKKMTIIVSTGVILLIGLKSNAMKNINTEITINATPEEVWQVLMNHEAYADWNPFIQSISGKPEVGEYIVAKIQMKEEKSMEFAPKILVNNTNQEFRWKGKLLVKGVFDGEHYFILEVTDDNKTRFVHGENFTGILSGLMYKVIGEDTRKGFLAMNAALKERVEKK